MYKLIKKNSDRLISVLAIFSLLFNLSQPILIVRAETASDAGADDEVVVEEEASEETSSEETSDEATEESSDESSDEVVAEETVTDEDDSGTSAPADGEEATEEESGEVLGDSTEATEEESDILEDGASDYRPQEEEIIEEDGSGDTEEIVETDGVEPEVEVVEEEEVDETVCLTDDQEIVESEEADWEIDGDVAETKDDVELGVKYIFPLDEDVSITFTCLPGAEDAKSHLKIEKINIDELDLPDDFIPASEYAYDITTDMEGGTFEYELSLPTLDEDADLSYIEKDAEEMKSSKVEEKDLTKIDDVDRDSEKITAKKLDHFSTYILGTFSDATFTTTSSTFAQGEHVYIQADYLNSDKYYRIDVYDFDDNYIGNAYLCAKNETTIEVTDFVLDAGAPIGTDWYALLAQYNKKNPDCNNEEDVEGTPLDTYFEVIEGEGSSIPTYGQCLEEFGGRMSICHATSSDGNAYNLLTSHPCNSIYGSSGHSGHFNEDGSPTSGHEDDTVAIDGLCPGQIVEYEDLNLTSVCSSSPDETRRWRVQNTNSFEVEVFWQVVGTDQEGSIFAPAAGDGVIKYPGATDGANYTFFETETVPGSNTTKIWWFDGAGEKHEKVKASSGEQCAGYCGDGLLEDNEQCDDGNDNNEDYCTTRCTFNEVCIPDVNMVTNGGFEVPAVVHEKEWNIFTEGFVGWRVDWYGGSTSHGDATRPEDAHLELHRGVNGWFPAEGSQYAELDTDWDGPDGSLNNEPASVTIYQNLPTIPGYEYRIEYSFSPRPDTPGSDNQVEFKWGGTPVNSPSDSGGINWTSYSYELTADSSTTEIRFTDLGDPNSLGTFLDDVEVTCLGRTTGEITGTKYEDLNGNGQRNEGEDGLQGWLIELYDVTGERIDTTTTDENGDYRFNGIEFGDYTVCESEENPAGWINTDPAGDTLCKDTSAIDGPPSIVDFGNMREPFCGNGIVEPGEECDGRAGVEGDDVCTDICKLIPVYDGDHSCPRGYAPDYLGTYGIEGDDPDGETISLSAGGKYLFEASWIFNPSNKGQADAAYTTVDNWETTRAEYGIWGTAPHLGAHALLADFGDGVGIVQWDDDQVYNQDHIYTKYYAPEIDDVQFVIGDRYGEWFDTDWQNQSGMGDNYGNLVLDVYECTPLVDVKICKQDTDQNRLSGWKVVLRNEDPEETVTVTPDGGSYYSSSLAENDYALLARGTYEYRGSSGLLTDPAYSERMSSDGYSGPFFPWINTMNLGTTGALGIMTNGVATNWSDYLNDDHKYALGYEDYSGQFEFSVYDNQYNDNVGDMYVDVYEGWVGTTGDDGCYTFEDVVEGDYVAEEIGQHDWEPQEGTTQQVSVSEENNEFIFTNKYVAPVTIVATKIVCEDESLLPNWGTGHDGEIDADFAQDFVNEHSESCRLEEGWEFQWGDDSVTNPGDEVYGKANGWNDFDTATDANGVATVEIYDLPDNLNQGIKVREVLQENHIPFTFTTNGNNYSAEIYCHEDILNYDNDDRIRNTEYGGTYYCVAWNVPELGDIEGYKWNDRDADGYPSICRDGFIRAARFGDEEEEYECEELMGGWTIFIDENSNSQLDEEEQYTTTATEGENFGWYSFEGLTPGSYRICEVQEEGWYQTTPSTEGEAECHTVQLPNRCGDEGQPTQIASVFDDSVGIPQPLCDFNFGNVLTDVGLQVTKENNTGGSDQSPGDIVGFTLTLTAVGGPVKKVKLTDLPAEGFDFVEGSGLANNGASEPTYASPGTWDLGDLSEDETVTITYNTKILGNVGAGLYKDMAWAVGEDVLGGKVLAQAVAPGDLDDNFVGTEVKVVVETEADEVDLEVEEETEIVEEVLGASTYLPATGSNTDWLYTAFAALLIGLVNILVGTMIMRKKFRDLKLFAITGFLFAYAFIFSGNVFAAETLVRIEEPESMANGPFEISFVVQDTEDRTVDAACWVKKPGSVWFADFQSFSLQEGGDTDVCDITNSVLDSNGEYKFFVSATPDGGSTVNSDEVTVSYDGEGPERPKYIEKDKDGSCQYELTVKTHQDGDTDYIEIYADDDKNIEANAGSRIATISAGPAEKVDYDHDLYGSDCGKTFYYAVRAFDDHDNPSDLRVEEITNTKTVATTTTDEGTTEEVGAIPVSGEGSILGDQEGSGEEGDEGEDGSILGEETEGDVENGMMDEGEAMGASSKLANLLKWAVIIGIVVFFGNVVKKKIGKDKK